MRSCGCEQARQQAEDTIPGGLTMTQYGAQKNNGEPMQCSGNN
ncbi:hypothetical protein O3W44_22855 [Pantoea sp. LMR881]|nr:hypothetical protein [Pantoea sp. LMR881]MCZ4061373.1 hypothetical protein [Pantoea sp. LMR881]